VTERQQLLGILGLIYLTECIRWVRRGGVVFNSAPEARVWRKSPLLNNSQGDAYIGWAFPTFGEFHVARGFPFSPHADGLLTFTAASFHQDGRPSQPALLKSWNDLSQVTAQGEKLVVSGQALWLCDTPNEAGRLAAEIRAGAALEPTRRTDWSHRLLEAQFDVPAIRERLADSRRHLRRLRQVGSIAWSLMFLAMPVAVWRWGWTPPLWIGIPLLFACSLWISREVLRFHREWFPQAGDDRFRFVLLTALSPVTAVRAAELLDRPRFEEFHPAAFAMASLPKDASEPLCAALWRDLKHPRLPLPALPADQLLIESRWRDQVLKTFGQAASKEGFDTARWDAPPARTESNHSRYCPRCHAQSTSQGTVCQDCGGIPLLDIPA